MAIRSESAPALTYTLSDFVAMKSQDELTYKNFAIINYKLKESFVEQSILDYYLSELKSLCLKITSFTVEEIAKYKYAPELLSFDIYGTTSLDFIILLCNGILDPKEFDFSRNYILLPKAATLSEFLSRVYNSESNWLSLNNKGNIG